MKLNVINLQGNMVKEILVPDIFQKEMNPVLYKEVLDYCQDKLRQNYAHVKLKKDMNYSKRKKVKQKGTGHARGSNLKQSQHRGGVSLFGPGGQVYEYHMNKKKKKGALQSILSHKYRQNSITICDSFHIDNHKTKGFLETMAKFEIQHNCLFVDDIHEMNFHLSLRNVQGMNLIKTSALNVLNASKYRKIVMTEKALNTLVNRLDITKKEVA